MVALKHAYTHFLIYRKQYHEILIHIHLKNPLKKKRKCIYECSKCSIYECWIELRK